MNPTTETARARSEPIGLGVLCVAAVGPSRQRLTNVVTSVTIFAMKDIGIRDLKTHASDLVRQVAEKHATYTITRHGRAVGVLGPPDFVAPSSTVASERAWERLLSLADKLKRDGKRRKSAVRELARTRR